jgi:hypothetical protein
MFLPAADANLVKKLAGRPLESFDKLEGEFIKINDKIN